jgi:hypothetical protein
VSAAPFAPTTVDCVTAHTPTQSTQSTASSSSGPVRHHRSKARINLVKVFAVSRRIGVTAAVGVVLLLVVSHLMSGRFEHTPVALLRVGVLGFLLVTVLSFSGILVLLFLGGLLERGGDARQFAKERRQALRWKIWLLRRTAADRTVRLEVFDLVSAHLAVTPAEPCGGFRERRLHRRYADLHTKVALVMERSRKDSLALAVRLLTGPVVPRDETLSVWHLSHEPQNYAVRRLLSEYLAVWYPELPRVGSRFRYGVVATPRWVWVLATRGERAWATGGELPAAIGAECVPLAGADVETVRALYEPGSSGPMGSLAEAVFAARTL